MTHIQILLPFGMPPATMAADLARSLNTPFFASLVSHAKASGHQAFEDFSRTLPHEICLANQFGLGNSAPYASSPYMAAAAMQTFGLTQAEGVWYVLNPVHYHIARDHLVLTDRRQLMLVDAESRALFDAAKPYFDEAGKSLAYGDAETWFLRADDWDALQTATPDAACGHNIDIWMPKGGGELAWRKLQNEVQMLWHTHPVNEAREARGLNPVNSLWLWGGSYREAALEQLPLRNPYSDLFNMAGWNSAFAQFPRNKQGCSAADVIAAKPVHGLLVLDQLIGPALANDWSGWLAQMETLERDWFTPMLQAIKAGKVDHLSLILNHASGLREFGIGKHSLRKFWVKSSLARLLP